MENEFAASEVGYGKFGAIVLNPEHGISRSHQPRVTSTGIRTHWFWQATWPGIVKKQVNRSFYDNKCGGEAGTKTAAIEAPKNGVRVYLDHLRRGLVPRMKAAKVLYKRRSFEHEREVRALVEPEGMAALLKKEGNPSPGAGRWVKINVAETIEQVLIAPDAPPWFPELVRQVTARYHQSVVPVVPSALAQIPFY